MAAPYDSADAAELDARIVTLKRDGLSFREVAAHPDVNRTLSYVYRCYQRGLRRIAAPAVEEYRARQLAEIETERALLEEIVHARHVVVSNGHIVSEITGQDDDGKPTYGDPLVDDGPTMAALDRLAKLRAQEQDLLGLKAATKSEVSAVVNYTVGGGVDPDKDLT